MGPEAAGDGACGFNGTPRSRLMESTNAMSVASSRLEMLGCATSPKRGWVMELFRTGVGIFVLRLKGMTAGETRTVATLLNSLSASREVRYTLD